MLGGNHFRKKFEKKKAKKLKVKEAKKEEGGGAKPKQQQQVAASSSSSGHDQKHISSSSNRSTLKGPVVAHYGQERHPPSRDSANAKKQVPFSDPRQQNRFGNTQNQQRSGEGQQPHGKKGMAATTQQRSAGASSRAQKRRFAKKSGDDLLNEFRNKLSGSTFRLLNEQVYSSPNAFAGQLLRDKSTFDDYHQGYRWQLSQWPVDPNQIIIDALLGDKRGRFLPNKSKCMPGYIPPSWVIADMGCGDAKIAQALTPKGYTVHSFDFCALGPLVTVADASNTPLDDNCCDIVTFSLSLMATDYFKNLLEAYRILKPKRLLKIIEVRSRVPHPHRFVEMVEGIGFRCDWTDVVGDYFVAFDFLKNDAKGADDRNDEPCHSPGAVLLPSLYKKR